MREARLSERSGERRLTVTLDPQADVAQAQIALVRALADRGCVPRSLVRGRPLEDKVIEVV